MSKRKHVQQYKDEYNSSWPVLKRSNLSPSHVFCSICHLDINIAHGGRDDCRRHVESNKHVEKAKVQSSHQNLRTLFVQPNDFSVIRAECLFTSFLVEHNCPLSAADHAGPLFKKMFPDSVVASKYGCARTKSTAIVKSFSDSSVEEITCKLKSAKFALATDGSNSLENEKLYPILVTYLDISLEKNVTMLVSLPHLTGDATGINIFNLLDSELNRLGIPWENCLAFSSDNASVMTGKFKGVIKFIQEKNDKVFLIGCGCHLIHLAAQHAAKLLDFPLEEFLVDIYYFLKKSPKRVEYVTLFSF